MNLMYLHSLCFLARKHPNAFIEELKNGKSLNKKFKINKRLKNKLVDYAKRYMKMTSKNKLKYENDNRN